MHNLGYHVYPTLLTTAAIAASSTDQEFAAQDMRGFEGIAYVGVICTTTATGTGTEENMHAEMSATSSATGTWINVKDSAAYLTTSWGASAQEAVIVDVFRPQYRWVRCVVDRNTTARQIDAAIAIQYRANLMPQAPSTTYLIADYAIVVGTSGSATG